MKTSRCGGFLLLTLAFLTCATVGVAAEVGLYRGQVPVADQSEEARAAGMRAALEQVLVKLSGQARTPADPKVAPLLEAAAELVEQYRYQVAQPALDESAALQSPGWVLVVEFSASTLDAELRRLGVARWPAERKPLLLWIAAPDPERGVLAELALGRLAQRGVPVLEPLWDLQDTLALDASGGGRTPEQITAASARYATPHWLLLEPEDGAAPIRGRWLLGGSGPAAVDELRAETPEDWVVNAVDAAVDTLAAAQAYLPGDQVWMQRLSIEGIVDYDGYRAVVDALEGLDMVRGLEVEAMNADRVIFVVRMDGEADLLWRVLAGDPRFTAVTEIAGDGDTVPLYLWREP